MAGTFVAKYRGGCGACSSTIKPDDEVMYDGTDTLVHAVCPEEIVERRGDVCPSCFMEMPLTGECGSC